jgi:hypothetical protein
MKISTANNLHSHIAFLTCDMVNHIAEQDWTADELEAFADFIRDMAALHGESRIAGEMYRDYKRYLTHYNEIVGFSSLEELEDPESSWLDDSFFTVKLAVEDMAAELVLYSGSRQYFSDAYAG